MVIKYSYQSVPKNDNISSNYSSPAWSLAAEKNMKWFTNKGNGSFLTGLLANRFRLAPVTADHRRHRRSSCRQIHHRRRRKTTPRATGRHSWHLRRRRYREAVNVFVCDVRVAHSRHFRSFSFSSTALTLLQTDKGSSSRRLWVTLIRHCEL